MGHFYNYNYETYGVTYNEVYTYDRDWNSLAPGSSGTDVVNDQNVTGINYNNYWINRYGADFCDYRAIGWSNRFKYLNSGATSGSWRRPNVKGPFTLTVEKGVTQGPAFVGGRPSNPTDYTNGGHPRIIYLGDRWVCTCGHCLAGVSKPLESCTENPPPGGCPDFFRYLAPLSGSVQFMSAEGATLNYDIEDWTIANRAKGFDDGGIWNKTREIQQIAADNGAPPELLVTASSDLIYFRLTTDPGDDGVPAVKKMINMEVQNRGFGNALWFHGMGIMIPIMYSRNGDKIKGIGGLLGGTEVKTWDGDSGTQPFYRMPSDHEFAGQWIMGHATASANLRSETIDLMRFVTGDPEYRILETPSYQNAYELEVGISGPESLDGTSDLVITPPEGALGGGIFAEVTATSETNTDKLTSNVLGTLGATLAPPVFNSGLTMYNIDSKSLWAAQPDVIPGHNLFVLLNYNRLGEFKGSSYKILTNTLPFAQGTATVNYEALKFFDDQGIEIFTSSEGGTDSSAGIFDAAINDQIGKTLTARYEIASETGSDSVTQEWYLEGFTGSTGPGATFDSETGKLQFLINEGTAFEKGITHDYKFLIFYNSDTEGGFEIVATQGFGNGDFVTIPNNPSRSGQVLTCFITVNNKFSVNDPLDDIQTRSIIYNPVGDNPNDDLKGPTSGAIYFNNFYGSGPMASVPWSKENGSNYYAGGVSFQDENIISGDENNGITRTFFRAGTPLSTIARNQSRTRSLNDDRIEANLNSLTETQKAELFAEESEDGIQFLINAYFEPAYKLGFRRFLYWTPAGNLAQTIDILNYDSPDFGMSGGTASWINASGDTILRDKFVQGSGQFPAASWTAMGGSGSLDPNGNLLKLTDAWSLEMVDLKYYDPLTTGYARPWTTNGYPNGWFNDGGKILGNWNIDDPTSTSPISKYGFERNRQDSWLTYFDAWRLSKAEQGDPISFYVYQGSKVPYTTIAGAANATTADLDWGNLSIVDKFGTNQSSGNGGWQIIGGSGGNNQGGVTAARQGQGAVSPWRRAIEPRVGGTGATAIANWGISGSTSDQFFWDQQLTPWRSIGLNGIWLDASSDVSLTNPGFVEYLENKDLLVGSEAWPMDAEQPGPSIPNRAFFRSYVRDIQFLALTDNGAGYAETRGWKNFNFKKNKMYNPRPDLGGISGDGLPTPDFNTRKYISDLPMGSGPEQELKFSDGSTFDSALGMPNLHMWLIFGNGNTAQDTAGWNASFRLQDPSTGEQVKRLSSPTETPVLTEPAPASVSVSDADFFDNIPRYYNEKLMKDDLDLMIDSGYTPAFSLGYNQVNGRTSTERLIRNDGSSREDISLAGRLQKYINTRLAGAAADSPDATQWLYLDIYDDYGNLLTEDMKTKIYSSSPRLTDQGISPSGSGATVDFRQEFSTDSEIPNDQSDFIYWLTAQDGFWTDSNGGVSAGFIPGTTADFEFRVFDGVTLNGTITNSGATGLMKKMFDLHDTQMNAGWGKSSDTAILNMGIDAVGSAMWNDWMYQYRGETYDNAGTTAGGVTFGTVVTPFGKEYEFYNNYPTADFVSIWWPTLVEANKRMAQMFRARYGFSKIGIYGIDSYQGWWEGLSNNPPALVDGITHSHDQWMQFTQKRINNEWINSGLFVTGPSGDNLDYTIAIAKQDKPDAGNVWSFPTGTGTAGFERVIDQVSKAYRPIRDKTLFMVNPQYSNTSLNCLSPSQWDIAFNNGITDISLGAEYPDVSSIGGTRANDVDNPDKLLPERSAILPYYMKHIAGFNIIDDNNYWKDFAGWSAGTLSDNDKMRYRLMGYQGEFTSFDMYNNLYKKFYVSWYRELYGVVSPTYKMF